MSGDDPKTFDDVLSDIRLTSKTEKEKGDRFEKLIISYFKEDTWYKHRFTKVQLFTRWLRQHGKSGVEKGVDIIAYEKEGGEPVGIQCKCYDDSNPVQLEGINSLLSECETHQIKRYILVYTSDDLSRHAREKAEEKCIQLINKSSLRNSSIETWAETSGKMSSREPHELRDYQSKVHDDVVAGFEKYQHGNVEDQTRAAEGLDGSRGKMLMACGTGKTLTSLRFAESLKCRIVLYLVPSISLIQQTMREWSYNSRGRYQYIAVCSDSTAGEGEEGRIYELEKPPSTNVQSFIDQFSHRKNYEMTVIFSTYQSVDIVMAGLKKVREQQGNSKHDVDLILCDEAHKTATKFKKRDSKKTSEESNMFSKAHYNTNISSPRRLYMTATPRIYDDRFGDGALSMDNQNIYGPTFSTISFYDAVHGKRPVLSDFKVKIAVLPEDRAGEYMGILDKMKSDSKDEKRQAKLLEHKAKYAAAWHGMLKPDDDVDPKINKPLQKIIVFTNSISDSMVFAGKNKKTEHGSFKSIAEEYNRRFGIVQKVETEHIDGGMRSYMRRVHLDWLDFSHKNLRETRIVSNARCLSEGVDVPSLDGVVFMSPKRSTVDVVQSVGRVMRKSEDKRYGYIILPVVVPGGNKAEEILDNSRFKHVWDVMNALRSHDPRLIAEMSIAGLAKPGGRKLPPRVSVDFLGIDPEKEQQLYGDLVALMTSRLVKKVGSVNYVQKYGTTMGAYAREAETIVKEKYEKEPHATEKIDRFHISMKKLISDSISLSDIIGMIADHVILKVVFDHLFAAEFASNNPVSKKLDSILKQLGLGHILAELGDFYEDVRRETDIINTIPDKNRRHETRQNFLKEIYNNYMSAAHKDAIDKGVVYTPTELVDFIIHSTQDILKTNMNKTLGDKNVQILEPFAGTGTFLTRLIDSGIIDRSLQKKYLDGMFANEVKLLAYYIASVNIETTYKNRMNELRKDYTYEPFPNISYTDTFSQNPHDWDPDRMGLVRKEWGVDDEYIEALKGRISKQNKQCIEVIMSNPPWGVAPKSHSKPKNDRNPKKPGRTEYEISERVESTYGTKTLVGKKKLHDWYVRALRWTSDRIGRCGVVSFVINGSILRNQSFAGVRAFLYDEFDEIYCFDVRGDAIAGNDGRNVFEYSGKTAGGTRSSVAIMFLIKNPPHTATKKHKLHYVRLEDQYRTGEQKRAQIKKLTSIFKIQNWKTIKPDQDHNWLDHPDTSFQQHIPIESGKDDCGIFDYYCNGVVTARDDWAYNSSHSKLAENMQTHIQYINQHINDPRLKEDHDPKKMKWDRDGVARIKKKGDQTFKMEKIRTSLYRPFFRQHLYFDWVFNAVWNVPEIMPNGDSDNLIMLVSFKTDPFSVLMTNLTPDLHTIGSNKCFALYRYEIKDMEQFRSNQHTKPEPQKIENISDQILEVYRRHYKNPGIKKLDVFYYVYGMLHHPKYKKKYTNNLKVSLPKIPLAPEFASFAEIGKQLADLHIRFDKKELRGLKMTHIDDLKVKPTNMRFLQRHNDVSVVHPEAVLEVNGAVLYDDLPQIRYTVNGRTPLGWFVERAKKHKKPHKVSGIQNNVFHGIESIGELAVIIKKLLYVGVESDRLIAQLPQEFEHKTPPKYEDLKFDNAEFRIIDNTSSKRRKKKRGS